MANVFMVHDEILQFMRPLTDRKIVLDLAGGQVVKRKSADDMPSRTPKKARKPGKRVSTSRAAAGSRANKKFRTVPTRPSDYLGSAPRSQYPAEAARSFDHGLKPDHKSRALKIGVEGVRDIFMKALKPVVLREDNHGH